MDDPFRMSEQATIGDLASLTGPSRRVKAIDVSGLRVLHVVDRLSMGGTQNLLIRTLNELQNRGVDSHLCVLAAADCTDESYRDLVNPTYLNFPGDYRNPLTVRRCVRQLQDVLHDLQPDILHSYLWVSDFVAARANRERVATHICHIVDRRDWQASGKLLHRIRRSITQRAFKRAGTRFVAVSQAAKDFACDHMGYSPDRVAVAANGVDWQEFADASERSEQRGTIILGTAGRVESEKGHSYLLEAVALLVRQGRLVELRITGEGPLKRELQTFVEQQGLSKHVKFLGWVSNVRDFYRDLDVFVVPSVNAEGLPTTILEAMVSGCAVVASDVGGAREAIRHGIDGCLVPPGNALALACEIAQLVESPALIARMADSARTRIREHFTTEKMVDVICQTYVASRKAGQSS